MFPPPCGAWQQYSLGCCCLSPCRKEGWAAQDTASPPAVRTITNIADASWDHDGERGRTRSNPVRFDVSMNPASPSQHRVFRRAPGDGRGSWPYRPPSCGAQPPDPPRCSGPAALRTRTFAPVNETASIATANVVPATQLRGGEPLFFEIDAQAANRDPAAIDSLTVELATTDGDSRDTDDIRNSTRQRRLCRSDRYRGRIPPALVTGDCVLSAGNGSQITLAAMVPGNRDLYWSKPNWRCWSIPSAWCSTAKPANLLMVSGVTLINTTTGAPATVFAEDGVTPWPFQRGLRVRRSPMVTGRVVPMGPGGSGSR